MSFVTSVLSPMPPTISDTLSVRSLSAFQTAVHISSALSIMGSMAVIFTYFIRKETKSGNNRLVLFMCIADFFGACHLFFGTWPLTIFGSSAMCTYQGYAVQFFLLSAFLWTSCISVQCLLAVKSKRTFDSLRHMEKYYHLICWGIPALSLIALVTIGQVSTSKLSTNVMGDVKLWCWISAEYAQYRMVFFFGPLWVIFLFNLLVYITIGSHILESQKSLSIMSNEPNDARKSIVAKKNSEVLRKYVLRTSMFFFAFIFTWSFGSINRIQNMIDPTNPIFTLFMLQAIFTPLQGFINSMVYFWATFILNRNRTVKNQKSTSQQTFTNNPSQAFATHKSDFKSLLHTPPPFQPTPPEKNESSYMPHTLSRDMSEDEQVGQRHTTSIQPSLETRLRLHEMIDDKGDVSTSKRESKMTIMSTESFELTFSPLMTLLDIEADDEIETVQYNGV